ncbi:MAG: putative 6-carboxy-5 6 7 8-tetrahydropterin synthase [Prokaryotic dsDNA virus sp.]|nr:MAG: putative 6-carboxy-5 6 7 8-tetrahydropterin synthase [Prokaryotic dsDNA virus sp.]|tara:strand:+ start:14193 stop:14594 length:402 start_codon:yes stop_codon:yes gene_type:complete
MKILKTYHFYAGHRNKEAGEKCGRLHGHTYDVKCTYKFDNLDNGITMLFSDIDLITEPIIKQYDHYFLLFDQDPLCELFDLANEPYKKMPFETSAENMAIWIFNEIRQKLPIVKIELAETKSSSVIYEKPFKD